MNIVARNNSELTKPDKLKDEKKTICVLQITRIGDLIQTFQACETLKKTHPEIRLILIARKQFAKPLDFLSKNIFDKVYLISSNLFFSNEKDFSLQDAKINLDTFLTKLSEQNISALVNLSFSKTSGFLSSLIPAKNKLGLNYNEFGKPTIIDKWSQYIYSNVMGGSLCGLHLVEIYKLIFGLKPSQPEKRKKNTVIYENIIIHPFSSHNKKNWKVSKWTEIIYRILKDHPNYNITLVGGDKDLDDSFSIINSLTLKDLSSRINNITGKTSIEELSHQLLKADIFVGHDSMVGNLAAYCNIPTLTISLGTVRAYETTPYHSLAYNISPKTACFPCFPDEKCDTFKCHTDIPYQLINSCINQLLNGESISKSFLREKISPFQLSSVEILKANFSKNNIFLLEKIDPEDFTLKCIFRVFYRFSWLYFLSSIEESIPLPILNKSTYEGLLNYTKGLQNLYELSEFGKTYSQYILEEISFKTPNIIKIKSLSRKIDEIDRLQILIKNTFPLLSPIVDYFSIEKSNLAGGNIVELTESSYLTFQNNSHVCSMLYELIEQTLSNYMKKTQLSLHQEVRK